MSRDVLNGLSIASFVLGFIGVMVSGNNRNLAALLLGGALVLSIIRALGRMASQRVTLRDLRRYGPILFIMYTIVGVIVFFIQSYDFTSAVVVFVGVFILSAILLWWYLRQQNTFNPSGVGSTVLSPREADQNPHLSQRPTPKQQPDEDVNP